MNLLMLQAFLIGNLGADAQKKSKDSHEFTTFRVAHNERWKDEAGTVHSETYWVDCILNGHPNVVEFLKAGATVAVLGDMRTRVYSSMKDRCMKAGVEIRVRSVELVGGRSDLVPSMLYDSGGVGHKITKYYHAPDAPSATLMTPQGKLFQSDANGWVVPCQSNDDQQNQPADEQQIEQQYDEVQQ